MGATTSPTFTLNTSSTQFVGNFDAGTVTFAYRVSSYPGTNTFQFLIDREKEPLRGDPETELRLALVVVHADAVERRPDKPTFGTYVLYVRGKLDDRIEREIQDALHDAIVAARTRAAGMDRAVLETLTSVPRVGSISVTATGERQTNEVVNVLRSGVKKRQESAEMFEKGGRADLVEQERAQIRVLEALLPAGLSAAELEALVAAAIADSGATSMKEIGKVMKVVLPKVAGRADGAEVNKLVRAKLPA